jgi:hypothetical protein
MSRVIHFFRAPWPASLATTIPALALSAFSSGLFAEEQSLSASWAETAYGLFSEAHQGFSAAQGREAELGKALTLLQLQPKTETNVNAAAVLLEHVLAGGRDDELGITARYFSGRIDQIHRTPVNPTAASLTFTQLIQDHPKHPLAGQAMVKLALIELYNPQSPADRSQAFARFAERAPLQTSVDARRDLHLLLGKTALRFDLGKDVALDQFTAALKEGVSSPTLRADTLVCAGELARELHRDETARLHYQNFLKTFPRDNRRRMIEDALASLPRSAGQPASSS